VIAVLLWDRCTRVRQRGRRAQALFFLLQLFHPRPRRPALLPIAEARGDPELAVPRLRTAIELQGPDYPCSRTFSRTRLASLLMSTDSPRDAAPIGRRAAEETAQLRSQRLVHELAGLSNLAARYDTVVGAIELRRDIDRIIAPTT